ncbi:MAG TPA: hypothetical protein VGE74_28525 [Gemmata sp.]
MLIFLASDARVIGWRAGEPRPDAIDESAARRVADAVVDDIVAGHHEQLHARMEQQFRTDNPPRIFSSHFEKMFAFGGKPLTAAFKAQQDGVKVYLNGTRKTVRKFWYAAQTTKSEGGPYFLFVEVVPDEGGPACTSVGLVNFPVTGPPAHLK